MTGMWSMFGAGIVRVSTKVLNGSKAITDTAKTAGYSLAASLARLLGLGVASDFRTLADHVLRRSAARTTEEEAKAMQAQAKARQAMAKAIEAENKATLAAQDERIAAADEYQKLALAAKTNAEAQACLIKAEGERTKHQAEAYAKVMTAMSNVKAKGGHIGVNPDQLSRLLANGPPSQLPQPGITTEPEKGEKKKPKPKPKPKKREDDSGEAKSSQ